MTCSTRLIFPAHPAPAPSNNPRPNIDTDEDAIDEVLCAPVDDSDPPSSPKFEMTSAGLLTKKAPLKRIVVRIEVSDTGHGIPRREMAQGKLFCRLSHRDFGERLTFFFFSAAFNQTERGRQQGGKGTGLGLALVRQIVKLSGGRLGVRSKVGQGSTFWVELRKFFFFELFIPKLIVHAHFFPQRLVWVLKWSTRRTRNQLSARSNHPLS